MRDRRHRFVMPWRFLAYVLVAAILIWLWYEFISAIAYSL